MYYIGTISLMDHVLCYLCIILGQTNTIFSLSLSTTDPNNRMVECNRLYQEEGFFSCEFCLELDQRTCFNLSDNSLANAELNSLEDGKYAYFATAYINDVPVASIFDNFSTCKFSCPGRGDEGMCGR